MAHGTGVTITINIYTNFIVVLVITWMVIVQLPLMPEIWNIELFAILAQINTMSSGLYRIEPIPVCTYAI